MKYLIDTHTFLWFNEGASEISHTAKALIENKLPFRHRDPFDRIIISQALAENIDVISKDVIFDNYLDNSKIIRIW